MTGPVNARDLSQEMTCVICLETFEWDGYTVYEQTPDGPVEVDLPPRESRQWASAIDDTFIRCENEIKGLPHFLPVDLARFAEEPVVIGLVGDSNAGKTCLMVAMSGEMERNGLDDYGLAHMPVSLTEHGRYVDKLVDPFMDYGTIPEHTAIVSLVEISDAVILRSKRTNRSFPLIFFDANGETLKGLQGGKLATRYFSRVDGLIFVADMTKVGVDNRDPSYAAVMTRLKYEFSAETGRLPIPAAIAITKSDLHRFDAPVDQWINRPPPPGGVIDPVLFDQESRDAFAFLEQRKGRAWLTPLDDFEECTLHFVSASGCSTVVERPDPENPELLVPHFARPARPRRVLEPLVALLSHIGVLDDSHAQGK